MLDRRRFAALSVASVLASSLAPRLAAAQAASNYPNRFVRLVVPFPPGGGTDAISRVLSATLSNIWGQQMVVENKGGGATSIGTETVAKADPDGYTVLLQSMPLAVNKFLFKTLPYDPVADLAPVSLICDYPNIMAVPVTSPARTVKEFIEYARANPGKATYASSGHGTSVHLSGELFNKMTGLKLQHIP
jgi:tripartite-type tricarboxylate transporter receptor subunit TctC